MLGLGDDLVFDSVDVTLDGNVFRLATNICTCSSLGFRVRSTAVVRGIPSQKGFKGDNWADERVVAEPRMIANLIKLHTLLRIRLEQFRDQVLGDTRETSWPLNALVQDVVKKLLLVFANEGWVTRQ